MKKILVLLIGTAMIFVLAGCKKSGNTEESAVTKWFDCLHGDTMNPDEKREIELDEFPGVTFCAFGEKIEAVTDKGTVLLYTGMPIWSVFFCDLNGDGKPELCSSTSLGSGIMDNRFIIYDYANSICYEKADRENYDFTLKLQDGKLLVEKRSYGQEQLLTVGEVIFLNGEYRILWNTQGDAGFSKEYSQSKDGTWQYEGQTYQFRLEITGRVNDVGDSMLVYLSNIESIGFEQGCRAVGINGCTQNYFSTEDAVLVEWKILE